MRKSVWTAALLVGCLALATVPGQAQDRLEVELRAGAGVPADDLGEAELDAGLGLDGLLAVRLLPRLWAYGGWGWHHFSADAEAWGSDADLEQTGYRLGLRWEQPLGGSASGPALHVHAGGTLEKLEVEDAAGGLITDTDHGEGWEAGAGLTIPVLGSWRLTPGVRYRGLSRPLAFGELMPEVYLEYVALDVGLSRRF